MSGYSKKIIIWDCGCREEEEQIYNENILIDEKRCRDVNVCDKCSELRHRIDTMDQERDSDEIYELSRKLRSGGFRHEYVDHVHKICEPISNEEPLQSIEDNE